MRTRQRIPVLAACALLALASGLCTSCTRSAPTQSENTTAAESQSEWGVLVTADEYGDKWPLTVSEARVNLLRGSVAILRAGGRTYALNGTAQSRGYQRIDPIWRDNPAIPGTKISISPLIQRALSLEED